MPRSHVTRQITQPHGLPVWLLLAAMVPATAAARPPARDDDPGIPIENAAVREACGSCLPLPPLFELTASKQLFGSLKIHCRTDKMRCFMESAFQLNADRDRIP